MFIDVWVPRWWPDAEVVVCFVFVVGVCLVRFQSRAIWTHYACPALPWHGNGWVVGII